MMIFVSMFASVPALASTDMVTYEHIDISSAATGKFWVNWQDANENTKANYSQTGFKDRHYDTDFFVDHFTREVIVDWPAKLSTQHTPTGTLSGGDTPIITSKTGVSYKMPTKTSVFENGKESINIVTQSEVKVYFYNCPYVIINCREVGVSFKLNFCYRASVYE